MRKKPSSNSKKSRKTKPTEPKAQKRSHDNFAIVAIGASAGGIEAVSELVKNLPTDTGLGFILVQHLDPHHQSLLTELVSRQTSMKVSEVTEGAKVEQNHIYVIPPNTSMSIKDHLLRLRPREEWRGVHMPIDYFMRALADANGNRSIGVILSGSGTDGTLGMAEIQAQGGVTFAQDDATAKYNSMPHSAIAAGCVDYVLPPKAIAKELTRLGAHHTLSPTAEEAAALDGEQAALGSIYHLLRRSTGVDFTHYRQTTVLRRIQRRMVVHKYDDLHQYIHYLQTHAAEVKALYQDMLINVTSFFRNPTLFDLIKSIAFPTIMKIHIPDTPIRLWAPGCASGEEPYSLAIALLEYLGDKANPTTIQLFGTDVSESSINKARNGVYPENIQEDVSPERLKRFFNRVEGGYRISKHIRDMCIFAQHNVLNVRPSSQIDLICCRNLLIYLEPVLQNKVLSLFPYALSPHGFLVLGTAEGLGSSTNLFHGEERSYKIYSKKSTAARQVVSFSLSRRSDRVESPVVRPARPVDLIANFVEVQKEFDRKIVSQFAPPTAFLNDDLEIVHSRGNLSRYLKIAAGRASLSILKMAREGLLLELRNALGRVKKDDSPVRKNGLTVKIETGENDGGDADAHSASHRRGSTSTRLIDFEVLPLHLGPSRELYLMVVFYESQQPPRASRSKSAQAQAREDHQNADRISKLEGELAANKEYLQSVIETQEATNEELQSANEEILSSNEELQSTNEELETAKEELQATNEELITVNEEVQNRNAELAKANSDLTNLIESVEVVFVMLDNNLRIRRFTSAAQKVLNLIPTDVGRPIGDIKPNIQVADLPKLIQEAISGGHHYEQNVQDWAGRSYAMKIRPSQTPEGKIEGAILAL